jgi:hypothetical protein
MTNINFEYSSLVHQYADVGARVNCALILVGLPTKINMKNVSVSTSTLDFCRKMTGVGYQSCAHKYVAHPAIGL